MRIITLDFETFWRSKDYTLSKMGPISYIRDPRFSAQLMSYTVYDSTTREHSPVRVVSHDGIADKLAELNLTRGDTITVAHNGNGFDFIILHEIYNIVPAICADTMCLSRWCGLSRILESESHATLTNYLESGIKYKGTVMSDGKNWPDDFTQEEQLAFAQYCINDTAQCRDNFFKMLPYVTADAIAFMSMTAKMACDPVLCLDDNLLTQYLDELDDKVAKARDDIKTIFQFGSDAEFLKAIRSSKSFVRMLEILGRTPPMKYSEAKSMTLKKKLEAQGKTPTEEEYTVYTPALSKADLDFTAMASDPDPRVALLVQTRLANNSSIQKSRAETFHQLAQSGRPLPVMLNAFKAHTSRYTAGNSEGSSDKLNLQNLSKRDPSQLTLRKAIHAPDGYTLVACDSSQIEARILAYVAKEEGLLDAFRHGADPYADLAEVIFGVPSKEIHDGAKHGDKRLKMYRNTGKTAILSAGYGVGAVKYSNTLLRQGVRLNDDLDKHHELAKHAHMVYRQSNSAITGFWNMCQRVIEHLYVEGNGYFGGPDDRTFYYGMLPVCGKGSVPSIKGPNGYILRYPMLTCNQNEKGKPEYSYNRPKMKVPCRIYGGALTENLCQYLAFALLQWQACRMAEHGVRIIANIHDSFLAICPEQDAEETKLIMETDMSQVPAWLKGFPVACEAEIGTDYRIA